MTKITLDSESSKIDVDNLECFLLDIDIANLITLKDCINIEVTSRLEELIL